MSQKLWFEAPCWPPQPQFAQNFKILVAPIMSPKNRFKTSARVFEDSLGRLRVLEKGSCFRILAENAEGVTVSAIFPHALLGRSMGGGRQCKTFRGEKLAFSTAFTLPFTPL